MREEFVVGKTTEKKQLRALCKGNSKEKKLYGKSTETQLYRKHRKETQANSFIETQER